MVYNGYYKVMSNIPKSWDIYQPPLFEQKIYRQSIAAEPIEDM